MAGDIQAHGETQTSLHSQIQNYQSALQHNEVALGELQQDLTEKKAQHEDLAAQHLALQKSHAGLNTQIQRLEMSLNQERQASDNLKADLERARELHGEAKQACRDHEDAKTAAEEAHAYALAEAQMDQQKSVNKLKEEHMCKL